MLVLSRSEVEELLDLDALLDALAAAHAELSAGKATLVPRVAEGQHRNEHRRQEQQTEAEANTGPNGHSTPFVMFRA